MTGISKDEPDNPIAFSWCDLISSSSLQVNPREESRISSSRRCVDFLSGSEFNKIVRQSILMKSRRMTEDAGSDYSVAASRADVRLIVDELKEMRKQQEEHHKDAATKADIAAQNDRIISSMREEIVGLKDTILALAKYLDQFATRRRMTIYSLFSVSISTALLILKIVHGQVIITTPWPELAVIISLMFFVMARTLPQRPKSPRK